ncbi:MAG TPA: hypothetical protein VNA27_02490 [Rubrobacteraceae bacterium]|nr:hypothetical protein [Rubrobacteraceae bacterium]
MRIDADLLGVVTLPVAEEGLKSYSCAGGWNLFMNANTRDPDAAREFIRVLSAPEQ